jgi:hypothetical protein
MFIVYLHYTDHRVPSANGRNLKPENMYATCPIFTCCTNHWVSSAKTWNSKPGVQHVHCSLTLHRSLSSKFQVPKPETRNWVCNMFIVHRVLSTKCWNPKPKTWKYVCNMSIFHLLHKSPSFAIPGVQHVHFFIYIRQIIEFQVLRANSQSPKPEIMYTTCPFFTHCTNHQVSSVETRNPVLQMDTNCICSTRYMVIGTQYLVLILGTRESVVSLMKVVIQV